MKVRRGQTTPDDSVTGPIGAPASPSLAAAAGDGPVDSDDGLVKVVGRNLRRLRTRRGYSLERLAKRSGVSRAMLSQIELGHSVPTINVLWKVARALDVPFASLTSRPQAHGTTVLRVAHAKILVSQNGQFTSRALFPFDIERKVEFYELRLAARAVENAEPHPPGTLENLVVCQGTVEITVGGESHTLQPGDAILFEADAPHSYRNGGDVDALMYLVMTYIETVG